MIKNYNQGAVKVKGKNYSSHLCILILVLFFQSATALASSNKNAGSNLPIPRFASIKSNEANARTGPAIKAPIQWVFVKKGEPIEIIAEYEQWRQIRDIKGEGGWVHSSVLSGRRNIVVISPHPLPLLKKPMFELPIGTNFLEKNNVKDNSSYFIADIKPSKQEGIATKKPVIITKDNIIVKLAPNLRCALKKCKNDWCQVNCKGYTGWVLKQYCWGA